MPNGDRHYYDPENNNLVDNNSNIIGRIEKEGKKTKIFIYKR